MPRDSEERNDGRVTRRNGTNVGGEFDSSRRDARDGSYYDDYSYLDERNVRDERRSRDDRDGQYYDDRRYRDDRDDRRYRDDRDDRRYRDDRDDRRYHDDRDDRRYRDDREDRRYRDDREDRRYRDDRDDRRYRDDRDDRRYRDDRDDRHYRDDRDDRRSHDERDDRREDHRERERRTNRSGTGSSTAQRGGNPDRTVHQLVPYALFCLSVFAGVSFFLRDFAGLNGQTGAFGSFLADFLCGLLGVIAYGLPVAAFVMALRWRAYVKKGQLLKKLILSSSFLVLLSGIVHVFQDAVRGERITSAAELYHNGVARVGGGFFGGFVGEWLGFVFRLPGTIILAIPLLVIIGIYLIDLTPSGLWQRIANRFKTIRKAQDERCEAVDEKPQQVQQNPVAEEPASIEPTREQPSLAVTRWSEPRPLEQSTSAGEEFSFSDEEDEPIILENPFASRTQAARGSAPTVVGCEREDAGTAQPAVATIERKDPPAPETVLQQTIRTQPEAPSATQPVGQPVTQPVAQPVVQSAPQPVSQPAAQSVAQPTPQAAAQPASHEQEAKPARVYAPFALPVQPFPERNATSPAVSAPTSPVSVAQPSQSTVATTLDETDEILGTFAPATRPAVSCEQPRPAPAVSAPVAQPAPAVMQQTASAAAYATVQKTEEAITVAETLQMVADVQDEPFAPQRPVAPSALDMSEEMPVAPSPEKMQYADPYASQARAEESYESDSYADDANFEEDTEENDSYAASAVRAAQTIPFDREYVEPARSAPTWDFAEEKREEEIPAPIPVQVERVEPQTIPAASYTPVTSYTPTSVPAPRVEVKTDPVKSEPASAPAQPPIICEYKRPPIDLLKEDENVRTDAFYEEIEETKDVLRQTMANFNIRIQDEINYSHGPSVTRYELRPVAGTSVRSVTNRIEDIALNLASSVRIEAPIPGKPAIGIEVPNKSRETVYMRTMLESEEFRRSTEPLEVPLGLDVGGAVRLCNLAKMPHLLVAGTTGSGKSVCINTILVSLIYKTSPEDLRLILIDPKQIEFAPYENVPHLYMPIVTDMQRAAGALACAVQEMERRFSLIKDVGVRNIESYNEAVKNDPDREHLPYIVIVIDEFNDLKMSCNNNDPENFTVRIAQKARAAGIHLIIGTQRPSVDVITGKLKGNIPSRIAFMVKQQVDSRTILDVNGAEALTGRGDMLYMATNASDKNPVRIQGAFVSDSELERVVAFVRRNNPPVQYNRAFMDQIEVEMAKAAKSDRKGDDFDYNDDEGGEDPKFVEAVELSIQVQKVATSLLQRRLGVGYGRAAKIIDRMEELGLVSAAEGNKPRKVLPAAQGYLEHIGAMSADGDDFGDEFDQ